MFFSLIVTTQGDRISEFTRLIKSLENQNYKHFELIVVDQSSDTVIRDISSASTLTEKYICTNGKVSLSYARNLGLKEAQGEIIAFPDDDCWYPSDLLKKVKQKFDTEKEIDCVCGCGYDPELKRTLSKRIANKNAVKINANNALKYPMSIGIFSKNSDVKFDEELGAGTKWGSGEESDYILKLLDKGYKIAFYRDVVVYHPYTNDVSQEQKQKNYRYGQGYGALIKKAVYRKQYGVVLDLFVVVGRSVGGMLYYRLRNNSLSENYSARLKGIFNGMKTA